jgi:hypothetical protein
MGWTVDARGGGRRQRLDVEDRARTRAPLDAPAAAWLVALPCAVLVVLAAWSLGPPLGELLDRSRDVDWLDGITVDPEPVERARYLIALAAPLLMSAATILLARRAPLVRPGVVRAAVLAVQLLGAGFLALCYLVQRSTLFGAHQALFGWDRGQDTIYFTAASVVVAAGAGAGLLATARSPAARARVRGWTSETTTRRIAAWAVAAVATALWFLSAVHFDDTVGAARSGVIKHLPFVLDETWAVLDGRSPLVDFASQYGTLWPYPIAAAMALAGPSTGSYTIAAAAISVLALLAVFDVLRRVTGRSLLALGLFLPFVATAGFMMLGPLTDRYAVTSLPSMFPLRYAGPLLLLWMTARHVQDRRLRVPWPLFLVAGLVVVNNVEFGIPALGATVAALLWTGAPLCRAWLARTAGGLVAGFAAAYVLVALLTLITKGALPDLSLVTQFTQIYGVGGFGTLPMQIVVGVALAIYLTFAGALGAATVRAVRRDEDRLLTGLLAWAGVFGLGVGTYYVGRSDPQVLTNVFAAWALAVVLLLVVALRAVAARRGGWPSPAEASCAFAFGLVLCSVAQWPTPWSQVQRLQQTARPVFAPPREERVVAAQTRRGEPVAIVVRLGHLIAYDLGLDNVSPYAGDESIFTHRQVRETIDALRAAGGTKLFVPGEETSAGIEEALREGGFTLATDDAGVLRFDAPWGP